MQSKIISSLLILLVFLIASSCCWTSNCGECNESLPNDTGFSFNLIDPKTGETAIGAWGVKYDSDLVSIIKENGDSTNYSRVSDAGLISFIIPEFPDKVTGKEEIKIFYIILPDIHGNPNRHKDSLKFEYKFKDFDCPEIWYDNFKVYYNDSLYHDGEYIDFMVFEES